MKRKSFQDLFIVIALTLAFLLPRLPALDKFSTLDEPYWLSMGANFYYALGQRQFDRTIYEYQPAVTTMWIVSAAMILYFPQYRGLGQGYLEFEKGALDPFMLEHGRDPLVLLQTARGIQVVLIAALMLVVFFLLAKFTGRIAAAMSVLFLSFEPFFLGQSRLLAHEALLALFVVISVLALAVYLFQQQKIFYLVLSGFAAALAQLTKSSAMAMLAPIAVCLLIYLWEHRRANFGKSLLHAMSACFIWLAILVAAYFIFWPGMWAAPRKMLGEVYGNAFSYAFHGSRLKVTGGIKYDQIALDANLNEFRQLTQVILLRTTPLTWLGASLGIILPFRRDRRLGRPQEIWLALLLLAAGIAFVLMFALARGRDAPHYTLTTYASFNLLAGMGWYSAAHWLAARITSLKAIPMRSSILVVVLLLQVWSALAGYPYYYTYENPLYSRIFTGAGPQFPYGEGLELAAQYLAQLPDAQAATALVYYARGCFSYFFPGKTTRFKPFFVEEGHAQDLLMALNEADYLVIYYAVQGRISKYAKLINGLAAVEPIHVVWLNGYEYVRIYRVADLPQDFYAALSQ